MTIANKIFSFPIRVYWEDTDAGGVVYHASYVRFLERARTEWLRSLGIGQQHLRESADVIFAIRAMQLDFHKPARLDDDLAASVDSVSFGRASMTFGQSLVRAGQVLVQAEVRAACLAASTFRPRPIPPGLFDACSDAGSGRTFPTRSTP
ncbi:tol-pal system-associated acyl-CoA thioesterase [Chiayiivirga flava]|uniref:tol-pal system-associated acyl-CoA thioesterase n=1 Tax=Chiayiivirga flava TaxID=659595 RepID=UPI00162176F3|nr:tol-pal system-associated acyl-CoA thioesterase [Chiayiivirga flava]